MTQPGITYPPQPGWWARTERIGVTAAVYKWASALTGVITPVGRIAASYGWSSSTLGLSVPHYMSGGSARTNDASPLTWTETIPANAALVIVWVGDNAANEANVGATIGGTPMVLSQENQIPAGGTGASFLRCFTMLSPPAGTQTFRVTNDNSIGLIAATAYYRNVGSLGNTLTAHSMSESVTSSSPSTLYAQMFTYSMSGTGDTISGYNQTQRSPSSMLTGSGTTYSPMVFGDALGNGGTLTFSASRSDTTYSAGSIILPLLPRTPSVNVSVTSGIPTGEAFGTPTVTPGTVNITATGIASGEAVGRPTLVYPQGVAATGIPTAEAFGTATVTGSTSNIAPTGIASGEAFGTPTVTPGAVNVTPTGIASAEAFGSATVAPGAVNLSPTGIASAEAFGAPTIGGTLQFDAVGTACAVKSSASPGSSLSGSGSHTAASGATVYAFMQAFNYFGSVVSGVTRSVTYGGTAMTSLGVVAMPSNIGLIEVFQLTNAPSGPQTVNYSVSGGSAGQWWNLIGNTMSFTGNTSAGSPDTHTGSSATSLTSTAVTSAANHVVIQAFVTTTKDAGGVCTISAYNQTQKYNAGNFVDNGSDHMGFAMGYAPGAASVTFTSTAASSATYASIAVDLS